MAKISTINVGSAANDGTGDTERAAWQKANVNTLEFEQLSRFLAGSQAPTIGFMGDSKAAGNGSKNFDISVLAWIMYQAFPCRLKWDGRTYANGGYNYGVGGSTTAQMVSTQIPQLQARTPDILWLESSNNDSLSSGADTNTPYNNTITTIQAAFDAGVKLIFLIPCAPRSSAVLTATVVQCYMYLNERLRAYARATPGVIFLDFPPVLADPGFTDYRPLGDGGVTGSNQRPTGARSSDGLHNSVEGCRAMAPILEPHFRRLFAPRYPRVATAGDSYHATNNPFGNHFGSKGMMQGTNGTLNAVANAGIAANWAINTAGGIVVTPTLGTGTVGRLAGKPVQILTLSGTTSGTPLLSLVVQGPYQSWLAGTSIESEIITRMNNCVNMAPPGLNTGLTNQQAVGGAGNDPNDALASGLDLEFFLFTDPTVPTPTTSSTNGVSTLTFRAPPGVTVSGTIEVGMAGMFSVA
jgi:lysophospholipase L1-like esterase